MATMYVYNDGYGAKILSYNMSMSSTLIFSVSDFVAYLNQTLEVAYPYVTIEGEVANFRVSKNRWVYFDLKDKDSSVRFFGTVYSLPGPLEDGMVVRVSGNQRTTHRHIVRQYFCTITIIIDVHGSHILIDSELLTVYVRQLAFEPCKALWYK